MFSFPETAWAAAMRFPLHLVALPRLVRRLGICEGSSTPQLHLVGASVPRTSDGNPARRFAVILGNRDHKLLSLYFSYISWVRFKAFSGRPAAVAMAIGQDDLWKWVAKGGDWPSGGAVEPRLMCRRWRDAWAQGSPLPNFLVIE